MRLNLPDIPIFIEAKNILIAGAGGGFDVYTGIPLGIELEDRGARVTYLSFANKSPKFDGSDKGTYSDSVFDDHLSKTGRRLHTVPRMGVLPYRSYLRDLFTMLKFDAVILCDGGVDSLMRGDEQSPGTLVEDSVSLAVYNRLDIPVMLVCLGMGTEVEEKVNHYRVMENISALFTNGYAGCCALTDEMRAFNEYLAMCERGWSNGNRKSHIHSRVIEAVKGTFGPIESNPEDARIYGVDGLTSGHVQTPPFINPLMGIYWFFDAHKVAARNLLVPKLEPTTTWVDVSMIYRQHLNELPVVRPDETFTL